MTPLEKLIQTIIKKQSSWKWAATQSVRCSDAKIYSARSKGFEIKLCLHDHAGRAHMYHDKTLRRKGMPSAARLWIEVTVRDLDARFGRRAIADREIIYPSDPSFESLSTAIREIAPRADDSLSRSKRDDRLSLKHSILAACKEL
jgi:hypothetical protein